MAENNSGRARAFRTVSKSFGRAAQNAALRSANFTRRNGRTGAAGVVGKTLRNNAKAATARAGAVERRRRKSY